VCNVYNNGQVRWMPWHIHLHFVCILIKLLHSCEIVAMCCFLSVYLHILSLKLLDRFQWNLVLVLANFMCKSKGKVVPVLSWPPVHEDILGNACTHRIGGSVTP
jgi:hypothetical protein